MHWSSGRALAPDGRSLGSQALCCLMGHGASDRKDLQDSLEALLVTFAHLQTDTGEMHLVLKDRIHFSSSLQSSLQHVRVNNAKNVERPK